MCNVTCDLTLNTWYPSVPPPGTSVLCAPPIVCNTNCRYVTSDTGKTCKMAERGTKRNVTSGLFVLNFNHT